MENNTKKNFFLNLSSVAFHGFFNINDRFRRISIITIQSMDIQWMVTEPRKEKGE